MSPFRLLLLAGLVWLVLKVLRSWGAPAAVRSEDLERFEPTARCASCKTLVPAQSLAADGRCGACGQRRPATK